MCRMTRLGRGLSLVGLACVLWSGCDDGDAGVGSDGGPPPAVGGVVGRLVLPAGTDLPGWRGAFAELRTDGSTHGTGVFAEDGSFEMDVQVGTWTLHAWAPGLGAVPVVVEVARGERTEVGDMALSAGEAAAIEGVAERAGADGGGHAGILIRALREADRDHETQTAADGRFRLLVEGGGVFSLEVSSEGYETVMIDDIDVVGAVVLDAPLILAAAPGRVSGSVLSSGGGPVDGARVELYAAEVAEPWAVATPDVGGRFGFEAVPPGEYALSTSLEGHQEVERSLQVEPGAEVDLGILLLPVDE